MIPPAPRPHAPTRRLMGLALTLLALVISTACKPKGELAICPAELASERAEESDTRALPSWAWFQRLAPRVVIKRPEVFAPDGKLATCSASAIEITWPDAAHAELDPRSRAELLPPRALTDADLTFAEAPGGAILVWARLRHFKDGTAIGPVALARWVDRGVEIRGIGTLWMPANRPRLRLETLGDDAQILVADAMVCPNDSATKRCGREVHLLPLIEQRFLQADLIESGDLAGPTRFLTHERLTGPGTNGWTSVAEVRRVIRFKGGKVTVAETIRTGECDPKTNLEVCDKESTSRDERLLRWDDKRRRFEIERGAWKKATAG